MEITKQPNSEGLELKITGRLDAYWSDQLAASIEESIRGGAHNLQLNLAQVAYLSSAGIRVLLKYYKQLKDIKGSLTVVQPSETAFSILELAGLSNLLIKSGKTKAAAAPAPPPEPKRSESETTIYYTHVQSTTGGLNCKLLGDPAKLPQASYGEADCQNLAFPESTLGLGIGAFGDSFADCKDRFGEFLAVGGVAAYLPTDGTNVPDYVMSEGQLVPEMKVLYGLTLDGQFTHQLRFDAKPEPPGISRFSEVIETALFESGAHTAGIVMATESAGLVGATLKQPPTKGASTFGFPEVREWISFTAERSYERALCLIVGVASRRNKLPFQSMLRPLERGSSTYAHFHAAIFPYAPLQRGVIDLYKTVNSLFGTTGLQSLMHLMSDDRELGGVGESELLRGACWIGPIKDIP